jgi:hypothetical protein
MHGGVAASNACRADVASVSRAVGWRGACEIAHFEPLSEPVLIYHTGGAPIIDVRHDHGRRERSRPGLLTLVPAGAPVDWYIGGDVHSYSLHLGADVFAARSEEAVAADANVRFRCGLVDPLLSASITALADELERPAQRGSLYADTIADVVGLHLLRLPASAAHDPHSGGGLSRAQLRRTLERLEDAIETGVSLHELARDAGPISPRPSSARPAVPRTATSRAGASPVRRPCCATARSRWPRSRCNAASAARRISPRASASAPAPRRAAIAST